MTVIVARADDKFSQLLREARVEVINLELLKTEVLDDLSEFENLIAKLDEYDGVFFTSPVAAAVFVAHVNPPVGSKIYALGKRAVNVLRNAGFEAFETEANTAEQLLAKYGNEEFAGKRLLFVRGERSMRTVPETLAGVATVEEVAVYRTDEVDPSDEVENDIREQFAEGRVDWICFFSPSAVEAFEKRFGTAAAKVGAIGETTAAKASELGFRTELIASKASSEVFARELIQRIQGEQFV